MGGVILADSYVFKYQGIKTKPSHNYIITHRVQLTASVSIINSGEGLPPVASPFEATLLHTTNLTVYVVPGLKSSMFVCILLFPVLGTSVALIVLL